MRKRTTRSWLLDCFQRILVSLTGRFNLFLERFFKSQSPIIVSLRAAIRNRPILRSRARALINAVRLLPRVLPRLQQKYREEWSYANRRLNAVMAARQLGGSVTTEELEHIFYRSRRKRHVLVLADGPEREQIELIVGATRAKTASGGIGGSVSDNFDRFDLVIVGPQNFKCDDRFANKVLQVGDKSRRSVYFLAAERAANDPPVSNSKRSSLCKKLASDGPIRVVFMNEAGVRSVRKSLKPYVSGPLTVADQRNGILPTENFAALFPG